MWIGIIFLVCYSIGRLIGGVARKKEIEKKDRLIAEQAKTIKRMELSLKYGGRYGSYMAEPPN